MTGYVHYGYTPVPFSDRSAVFESVNILMEKYEHVHEQADEVTLKTWEAYIALCKAHHIKLCLITTTQDAGTERLCSYFAQQQVPVVQVSFPGSMTFKPVDSHPNSAGHRHFAALVYAGLAKSGWLHK